MKTYFAWNHQGKADMFVGALFDAGYRKTEMRNAQVLLMDIDTPGRVGLVSDQIKNGHSKLFCYPHAARPFIGWDGLFTSSQYTSASFVFAEGHIEVIRAYGYKKPLHAVGWAYSEIRPFQPAPEPRRVLFAPIHPNRNGWLSALDKDINARTYQVLLDMLNDKKIELTVRHIHSLEMNGMWNDKRVQLMPGETNTNQNAGIEEADVVVSHQTYAWKCAALGKPTVMMAECEAPRNGGDEATFKRVKSWESYKHLLMYPLDILNTPDPYGLLVQACTSDELVRDWKKRMIGTTMFCAEKFTNLVKLYCEPRMISHPL